MDLCAFKHAGDVRMIWMKNVVPTKAHLDDSVPEVQLICCLIQQVIHLHAVAVSKRGTDGAHFSCQADQLGKADVAIGSCSCQLSAV